MFSNYWIWLAILFSILTNIGFKYAAMVQQQPSKKWTIFSVALIFGLLNSICMTEALKTIPLNIASAVFFSLTIVGLLVVSYFLFNDVITWKQIAGTAIIIVGVIMINL